MRPLQKLQQRDCQRIIQELGRLRTAFLVDDTLNVETTQEATDALDRLIACLVRLRTKAE